MKLTRPLIRYHGGKWKLSEKIIPFFPNHRVYIEPYGGGASILLRKPRSYAEVYNDLDGEIVNLFRVVRDRGDELRALLELTPFSRDEYRSSFPEIADELEQARRTVIRSHMGFGSNALARGVVSGFRSNSNRSGTTPARDWRNLPDRIPEIIDRMRGVVIENRDALEVMVRHDREDTLHYCDPPYVHDTRSGLVRPGSGSAVGYSYEMTDEQHRVFAAAVKGLQGMVIVSGYGGSLYDTELFTTWTRYEIPALADGARERVEVLWMNKAAANQQLRLIA
jgi:DNA adenine methylase